ncbi:oligosaccharide flippase family protein [Solidesulfovibrio sp.]
MQQPDRPSHQPQQLRPQRSLVGNFLALAVSRGVQTVSGFFVLLAVARVLPVEDFGRYASVSALAGAVAALTYFGIQQVMIRAMVCDRSGAALVVGRAVVLRLSLAVVAGLALAVAGYFSDYGAAMYLALGLAFGLEVCRSFSMLGCAVFQAHERMGYEPPLSVISGLAAMILVGLALWGGYGVPGVLAGLLAAASLNMGLVWRVAGGRLTRPSFALDWPGLRAMFLASSVVGLGVFFQQNLFRAGALSLTWWAGLAAVADFQAPHEFLLKLEILPQALMLAVFPALARLAPVDANRAERLYRLIFRHTLQGMALPTILLAFYAEPACVLLFGEKYAGAAPVMRILALSLAPLALDMLVNNLLVAIGRQRYALYYAAAALVLAFGINALVTPRAGAVGAAWVALGSYGWLLLFSSRFAARHGYACRPFGALVRVACAGGACLGACFLLGHVPIVGALAGSFVYVAVMVALKGIGRQDLAELRAVRQARPEAGKDRATCP